jgi:hypothetical protein
MKSPDLSNTIDCNRRWQVGLCQCAILPEAGPQAAPNRDASVFSQIAARGSRAMRDLRAFLGTRIVLLSRSVWIG